METPAKNESFFLPKTMAELFPELCKQSLTAKKQPRSTIAVTRTSEKVIKPMTIAELRTALKIQSPKRNPQPNTATKKLKWNSSVKPLKTKSHTANEQLRDNSVRKVLECSDRSFEKTLLKMDTVEKNESFLLPKTMAELFPDLCGQSLTAKKQPRSTNSVTRTSEKVIKPMTIAELRTALKIQSPKRNPQPNTATKKLRWNSSVKPLKTKSHTSDEQLRHNSVRKVLNFVPKPKPATNVRATLISSETPKFSKPEFRAKKSLHLQDKNSVRISGVCHIPQTPIAQNKTTKPIITMHQNKENKPYLANINRMKITTPKNLIQKKIKQTLLDTPLSNLSFKSNGDASFLLKEQEINDIEERTKALGEESILENIAEVSPPVSTPFKEYRNVEEFFNNTGDTERSYNDNTIMSLDKSKASVIREQSVIVSLCDELNKAAVTDTYTTNTELNDLLEIEKHKQHNIEMMMKIVESQLKTLEAVRKLINNKRNLKSNGGGNVALNHVKIETETPPKKESIPEQSSILRPSVIKVKSPSYKIPRKSMCLRKKVISKSMLNESQEMRTPVKSMDKAWNMYMQIKQKMNFLNTPSVKRNLEPQDTPSLTSHNLKTQLDKLYNGS